MLSCILSLSSLILFGKTFTAAAQTALPVEPVPSVTPTEATETLRPVLFKLGTGFLPRSADFGGFRGITLPIAIGAEYVMKPNWNVYVNAVPGINAGGGQNSFDRYGYIYLSTVIADLGVRHYYNQDKRQQQGWYTGPFTGNYVALQSSSVWFDGLHTNKGLRYDYSNLVAIWGMQRRFGGHGLVDAYAGSGISNHERAYRETINNTYNHKSKRFPPKLELVLGVKLSLVF